MMLPRHILPGESLLEQGSQDIGGNLFLMSPARGLRDTSASVVEDAEGDCRDEDGDAGEDQDDLSEGQSLLSFPSRRLLAGTPGRGFPGSFLGLGGRGAAP